MKHFDYPQLPEELQKGLNDYCKFWEQGLKKRANAVIWEIMKYYDTLSEDVHKEFISIVCNFFLLWIKESYHRHDGIVNCLEI